MRSGAASIVFIILKRNLTEARGTDCRLYANEHVQLAMETTSLPMEFDGLTSFIDPISQMKMFITLGSSGF